MPCLYDPDGNIYGWQYVANEGYQPVFISGASSAPITPLGPVFKERKHAVRYAVLAVRQSWRRMVAAEFEPVTKDLEQQGFSTWWRLAPGECED